MRRLIIFLTLLIIPDINLLAKEGVILEHADHAEYLKINGDEILTLWGGVKINSGKMKLEADWVQLNLSQDELLARGNVILIDEQENKIESKEVRYNLGTKRGNMKSPYLFVTPYYCRGDDACFEPGTITFSHVQLTTCDLPDPHYHLACDRIIVYPHNKIMAKKILFKIGKVPLFYLPSCSMSLKPRKIRTTVNLGQSNVKGTSVGITADYLFTQKSIASLHLNFLEAQGIGTGIEHNYWKDSISQGTSYLYYINERKKRDDVNDTKRWEVSSKQFQRFKDITGILHLQLLSDRNVTRDYLQGRESSASTLELKNYLVLTKTYPNQTIRLVCERKDIWNNQVEDFEKETSFLPKLTLQTKLTKKNNIYPDLKVEVTNQSGSTTNNLKTDVGVNLLSKAIFLSDKVVFSPKIGLSGTFQENEKASEWLNTSLNLRNKIGRYLEVDLNHNLKKKATTDEYHGIETNILNSTLYLWMNRRVRGEVSTGIDLRKHKHESLKLNKDRLLPIVTNLNLALSNNFSTSLKTTFSPSKIEEVETYFNFKKDNWQYGGSGLYRRSHSEGIKDIMDISNYLAFNLSPKTHLRVHSYYDVENHRMREYGLTMGKDLHCWDSKFSIQHGQETEIRVNFNLK